MPSKDSLKKWVKSQLLDLLFRSTWLKASLLRDLQTEVKVVSDPREDLRFQGAKKEKDDRKAADVDDGGGQAKGCRDSGDHCGSQLEEAL